MLTLSMVISAFNYALTTPIINENGFLEFTAYSERLIVCHIHDEFHFSLTIQTLDFYVTFNIGLHLEQCESNSAGPAPDEQDLPSYHPQSDTCLVLPGVPFKLPCPLCARPLE